MDWENGGSAETEIGTLFSIWRKDFADMALLFDMAYGINATL